MSDSSRCLRCMQPVDIAMPGEKISIQILRAQTRLQALAAAAAGATPVTGEFILTPAHSSDDDEKNQHLEWTYLEAARPTVIELQQHGGQLHQQQHQQQQHQQQQQHLHHPEVATVSLTDLTPITGTQFDGKF